MTGRPAKRIRGVSFATCRVAPATPAGATSTAEHYEPVPDGLRVVLAVPLWDARQDPARRPFGARSLGLRCQSPPADHPRASACALAMPTEAGQAADLPRFGAQQPLHIGRQPLEGLAREQDRLGRRL